MLRDLGATSSNAARECEHHQLLLPRSGICGCGPAAAVASPGNQSRSCPLPLAKFPTYGWNVGNRRFSFSPKGFDDEDKKRAADCEVKWNIATGTVAALGVATAVIFPPAAPGLLLVAAIGPVMGYPFTRARLDPFRYDFYEVAAVRDPLGDPSVANTRRDVNEVGPVATTFCLDRAAAHVDAMVTAAERALGAYRAASESNVQDRLIEVRHRAQDALSGLTVASDASSSLIAAQLQRQRQLKAVSAEIRATDRDPTVADLLEQYVPRGSSSGRTVPEILVSCGELGERALALRPLRLERNEETAKDGPPQAAGSDLAAAINASGDFLDKLLNGLPQNSTEFVSAEVGEFVSDG